jgi:hypothetical protein
MWINFMFQILTKQQQNGLEANQTKVYGQNNAKIGRNAATG